LIFIIRHPAFSPLQKFIPPLFQSVILNILKFYVPLSGDKLKYNIWLYTVLHSKAWLTGNRRGETPDTSTGNPNEPKASLCNSKTVILTPSGVGLHVCFLAVYSNGKSHRATNLRDGILSDIIAVHRTYYAIALFQVRHSMTCMGIKQIIGFTTNKTGGM
jgi:hypothetical protein